MADIIEPGCGAAVLADHYTKEIGDYAKRLLPLTLSNDEYTTRLAALIVAFNRMLAEHVVTSSVVNGCDLGDLGELTVEQLARNIYHAQAALNGEGSTVQ